MAVATDKGIYSNLDLKENEIKNTNKVQINNQPEDVKDATNKEYVDNTIDSKVSSVPMGSGLSRNSESGELSVVTSGLAASENAPKFQVTHNEENLANGDYSLIETTGVLEENAEGDHIWQSGAGSIYMIDDQEKFIAYSISVNQWICVDASAQEISAGVPIFSLDNVKESYVTISDSINYPTSENYCVIEWLVKPINSSNFLEFQANGEISLKVTDVALPGDHIPTVKMLLDEVAGSKTPTIYQSTGNTIVVSQTHDKGNNIINLEVNQDELTMSLGTTHAFETYTTLQEVIDENPVYINENDVILIPLSTETVDRNGQTVNVSMWVCTTKSSPLQSSDFTPLTDQLTKDQVLSYFVGVGAISFDNATGVISANVDDDTIYIQNNELAVKQVSFDKVTGKVSNKVGESYTLPTNWSYSSSDMISDTMSKIDTSITSVIAEQTYQTGRRISNYFELNAKIDNNQIATNINLSTLEQNLNSQISANSGSQATINTTLSTDITDCQTDIATNVNATNNIISNNIPDAIAASEQSVLATLRGELTAEVALLNTDIGNINSLNSSQTESINVIATALSNNETLDSATLATVVNLQSTVATNKTNSENADTALGQRIDSEIVNRQSGDTAAIASANAYTNDQISILNTARNAKYTEIDNTIAVLRTDVDSKVRSSSATLTMTNADIEFTHGLSLVDPYSFTYNVVKVNPTGESTVADVHVNVAQDGSYIKILSDAGLVGEQITVTVQGVCN